MKRGSYKKQKKSVWDHADAAAKLWIAAMLLCIVSKLFEGTFVQWLLILSGVAVAAVAVVYRFQKVRCPHCGSHMTAAKGKPKRCPDCGGKLI